MHAKTLMGLEPFEVSFFFEEKFTKIEITPELLIRNRLKAARRIPMMFSTIWLKNLFFSKSHMEKNTRMKFFYTPKKKSVTDQGIFGRKDQKKIGTIKDLPIWFFWNKAIFVSQNSYGHTMVWRSISSDFFSTSRDSIESRSKLAINQIASRLVVSNHSDWSKSLMGTVFYVSTPFLLVVAVG